MRIGIYILYFFFISDYENKTNMPLLGPLSRINEIIMQIVILEDTSQIFIYSYIEKNFCERCL